MTYPGGNSGQSGEKLTYTYNNQMTLKRLTGTSIYVDDLRYDASGRMTRLLAGSNLLMTQYQYYPWEQQGGRLHWLTSGTITDAISLQKLEYDYDPLGNLDWIKDYKAGINPATPQTQSFGYDSLNRLTSASATGGLNGNGNYSESYSYNATTGNLASKTGLGNYTYNAQVTCAAGTRTLPHAVSSAGGNSYTYDCNGSQVQRNVGGTQNLSYNAENKLVSVSGTVTAIFVYDGDGKRVKSTINGSSVVYIGNDYEWTSSGVTQYYTSGSQRVGMRRSGYAANNGLFWLMGDHLGSTSITASANGSFFSKQRYTAWGSNRYTSGSLLSQRQYTGQINDGFGLYFYNARFYDPYLNRWTQPDTIIPEEVQGVQAWDRYAYVNNNPVRYTDSSGHFIDPFSLLVGAMIVGALVGGVVDAYQQYQATGTIDAGQVAYSALGGAVLTGGVVIAGIAAVTVAGGVAAAVTGVGVAATAACADGDPTNEALAAAKTAESVIDKLNRYLLNPNHTRGSTMAAWYEKALGFSQKNLGDLAKQIVFDPKTAYVTEATRFGIKYNQIIPIAGANGKVVNVLVAWIQLEDGTIKLVTTVPAK